MGGEGENDKPYRLFPSIRFFMFMLHVAAMTIMGGGFAAFNFAIVCMSNETAISSEDTWDDTQTGNVSTSGRCGVGVSELVESKGYDGEFLWDRAIQSHLLAAHAYGAILMNIPAGLIADRYGSKLVIAVCLVCNAVSNGLTPLAAYAGVGWLFAVRIIQGFGYGASWPATMAMVPTWSSDKETGTMLTMGAIGYQLGTLVAMITSSSICESVYRWPFIFYLWCALSVLFIVLWMIFYTDDPSKCPFINQSELEYIRKHKTRTSKSTQSFWKVPWRYILLSPSAVATHLSQFAGTWSIYYIGEFMPTYSKEVLRFDVRSNGLTSSLPALAQVISRAVYGPLGDRIPCFGRSVTFSVKVYTAIGTLIPCVCYILLGFLDCNRVTLALVAFSILSASLSTSTIGYCRGGVLMAPRYAGAVGSVSNTYGDTAALVMPYIVGVIARHGTVTQWQHTLWLSAGVMAISFVGYMLFGTAQEQKWAVEPTRNPVRRKVYVLDTAELENARRDHAKGK